MPHDRTTPITNRPACQMEPRSVGGFSWLHWFAGSQHVALATEGATVWYLGYEDFSIRFHHGLGSGIDRGVSPLSIDSIRRCTGVYWICPVYRVASLFWRRGARDLWVSKFEMRRLLAGASSTTK